MDISRLNQAAASHLAESDFKSDLEKIKEERKHPLPGHKQLVKDYQ